MLKSLQWLFHDKYLPNMLQLTTIQLCKHVFVHEVFVVFCIIFQIVNVFDKVTPFTFIINHSQCSYELILLITYASYVSSIHIIIYPTLMLLIIYLGFDRYDIGT